MNWIKQDIQTTAKCLRMSYKKTKKKHLSVRKRLLFEGLFAGIIFGISAYLGFSLEKDVLGIRLFQHVCTLIDNQLNCGKFAALISILALVFTIVSFILELRKLKKRKYFSKLHIHPWVEGVIIYALGLFSALLLIIIILPLII